MRPCKGGVCPPFHGRTAETRNHAMGETMSRETLRRARRSPLYVATRHGHILMHSIFGAGDLDFADDSALSAFLDRMSLDRGF